MHKLERLLAVILALHRHRRLTAQALASLLEVDVRTIYRDMDALSQLGVPVVAHLGPQGGYALEGDYFIPPVMFTRDEVLALRLTEHAVQTIGIPGTRGALRSVFLKLDSLLDAELRSEWERIRSRVLFDVREEYPDADQEAWFRCLLEGMDLGRKLRVVLRASPMECCILRPYALCFLRGAWELVAFDEGADRERRTRLEHIAGVELLGEGFALPADFCTARYYACREFADNFHSGDRVPVSLWVSERVFREIKDQMLYKDARIETEAEGRRLDIATTRPEEYLWAVVRHWPELMLKGPAWLVASLAARLHAMRGTYPPSEESPECLTGPCQA